MTTTTAPRRVDFSGAAAATVSALVAVVAMILSVAPGIAVVAGGEPPSTQLTSTLVRLLPLVVIAVYLAFAGRGILRRVVPAVLVGISAAYIALVDAGSSLPGPEATQFDYALWWLTFFAIPLTIVVTAWGFARRRRVAWVVSLVAGAIGCLVWAFAMEGPGGVITQLFDPGGPFSETRTVVVVIIASLAIDVIVIVAPIVVCWAIDAARLRPKRSTLN